MKKLLILLILSTIAMGIDPFSFIEGDKRHHAKSAFYIDYALEEWFNFNLEQRLWSMAGISLLKGAIDVHYGGQMDIWDGVANFSGLGARLLIDEIGIIINPDRVGIELKF